MKLSKEQAMLKSKGLIFDIKRFAVHDGAGLRTTIFLKGCPLHCIWCQNPEGISSQRTPLYMSTKCIHCKLCQSQNIDYKNDRPYFLSDSIDEEIKNCPSTAIRYDSNYQDTETLMKEIIKDKVFYRENGGVTFSGGEPFHQHEFLIEMLKKCKENNLSTAIETTLFVNQEILKQALPYVDIIYADFKLYDDHQHQYYTSQSNKIIKENFTYLLTSKYKDKVVVRTPLIPTITATKENLTNISHFIYSLYPQVKYELLNYNPLAPSKYDYVNFDYGLKDYPQYTKEEMLQFNKWIKKDKET